VGYPIVVDWATSVIAMGRVEQYKREGLPLPSLAAVDREGNATTDPNAVAALLPFGGHKGYGLALINEIVGALIGGSLPTLRSRWDREPTEKHTCAFFFQVIHPDAISGGSFAKGRDQAANVKAVIEDVLGHGNERCMLPGQVEADWARKSAAAGGLLFTGAEVEEFGKIAQEAGLPRWDSEPIRTVVD
jgi:LDH2 family malate/lactate/ureidoglycolate dehydrogenase